MIKYDGVYMIANRDYCMGSKDDSHGKDLLPGYKLCPGTKSYSTGIGLVKIHRHVLSPRMVFLIANSNQLGACRT
jgi:hypothetical protein